MKLGAVVSINSNLELVVCANHGVTYKVRLDRIQAAHLGDALRQYSGTTKGYQPGREIGVGATWIPTKEFLLDQIRKDSPTNVGLTGNKIVRTGRR